MSAEITIEERARRMDAALAEIGYPVGSIVVADAGDYVSVASYVRADDGWRAGEVAGPSRYGWTCRACVDAAAYTDEDDARRIWTACIADRPMTVDCGAAPP